MLDKLTHFLVDFVMVLYQLLLYAVIPTLNQSLLPRLESFSQLWQILNLNLRVRLALDRDFQCSRSLSGFQDHQEMILGDPEIAISSIPIFISVVSMLFRRSCIDLEIFHLIATAIK